VLADLRDRVDLGLDGLAGRNERDVTGTRRGERAQELGDLFRGSGQRQVPEFLVRQALEPLHLRGQHLAAASGTFTPNHDGDSRPRSAAAAGRAGRAS
jgi:hypothetical protein